MSGVMFMLAACIGCGKMFSSNPDLVPSVRVKGEKEPLCKECSRQINKNRKNEGLSECYIHPDAYEVAEV